MPGAARLLGVSNVSLRHLEQMGVACAELPAFVQNRCYARLGWDREVRAFCRDAKIYLSGIFAAHGESGSGAPSCGCVELGRRWREGRRHSGAGCVRFRRGVGMLPLTGTSNADHMKQDLASRDVKLPPEAVEAIESLAR